MIEDLTRKNAKGCMYEECGVYSVSQVNNVSIISSMKVLVSSLPPYFLLRVLRLPVTGVVDRLDDFLDDVEVLLFAGAFFAGAFFTGTLGFGRPRFLAGTTSGVSSTGTLRYGNERESKATDGPHIITSRQYSEVTCRRGRQKGRGVRFVDRETPGNYGNSNLKKHTYPPFPTAAGSSPPSPSA